MNDLDRILSEETVIRPSSGFRARVMDAVHAELAAPAPMDFPWRRFLPGIVTSGTLILLLLLGGVLALEPADFEAAPSPAPALDSIPAAIVEQPLLLGALALAGSLLVAWLAVRFAMRPQELTF
ncbi:MAG: hypothetical protein GWM93_14665 [Gemmatimonadetes bacterium]|nr:hypothetical protein [Gemmatimonadota bacterium]NIT67899.1 hypothetical protein [Gemmatimonadota bacterium]NIY36476.1 hypothetical protein [Gemmatimonadota bacterium]